MKKIFYILINVYRKHSEYFQGKLFSMFFLFYKYNRVLPKGKALSFVLKNISKFKVYKDNKISDAIYKMLDDIKCEYDLQHNVNEETNKRLVAKLKSSKFFYYIDEFKSIKLDGRVTSNLSIDYSIFLSKSLEDLKINGTSDMSYDDNRIIDSIINYIDKIEKDYKDKSIINKDKAIKEIVDMKTKPARDLFGALQRILFINSIEHMTNHYLVGLGRLDKVLLKYYDENMDDEEIKEIFADFYRTLHTHYIYKSRALMGDTGQIIILSGYNDDKFTCDNINKYNKLSKLMLDAFTIDSLPDPKPMVRINKNTDNRLYDSIYKFMTSNMGSVLLSNDDLIIDALNEDGYDRKDSINYVTSACWEPLAGRSFEQNNILSINLLEPFSYISKNNIDIKNEKNLFDNYIIGLKIELDKAFKFIDDLKYSDDPLYNLVGRDKFLDGEKNKYKNFGIFLLGMSNLLDSFFNIKEIVFEEKRYDYKTFDNIRKNNFIKNEKLKDELKKRSIRYGKDEDKYIKFVNDIIDIIYEYSKNHKCKNGGHIRFGLSSQGYIMDSFDIPASFDGRLYGEPLEAHISSRENNDYLSLLNFASKLDYKKRFYNGMVVDFTVNTNLLYNHKDKFLTMLKVSFDNGVGQMQFNVLSKYVVLDAVKNPDMHRDLIVRVWGFNAYFTELPKEYQAFIYKRTVNSERID